MCFRPLWSLSFNEAGKAMARTFRFQHIAIAIAIAIGAIAVAREARSDDYRKITVTDIILDQGHLDGVNVEVVGWIGSFADHWLIKEKKRDPSSVYVDIQLLPREARRVLLSPLPGMPSFS